MRHGRAGARLVAGLALAAWLSAGLTPGEAAAAPTTPAMPVVDVSVGTTAIAQDYYVLDALAGNPLATGGAYLADWKAHHGWSAADEAVAERYMAILDRYQHPLHPETAEEVPRPQPRFAFVPVVADRISFAFLGSRTPEEAWGKVALLVTPTDLKGLREAFDHFEPRLAAWRSRHAFAAPRAREFDGLARRYDVQGFLSRAAAFFGVPADAPIGMRFVIVPLPASRTSHARVVENYSAIELQADDKVTESLDKVVHEVCHHLIDRAGTLDRATLAAAYAEDRVHGVDAFGLFNEAVATALGHGVFMDRVRTVRDIRRERWRTEDFLDTYSKALYPILKRSMATGRPLDAGFVRESLAAYGAAFGPTPTGVLPTLHHVLFVAGRPALRRDLRRAAQPNVITRLNPADAAEALKNYTFINVFAALTPAELAAHPTLGQALGLSDVDVRRLAAGGPARMVVRPRPDARGRVVTVVAEADELPGAIAKAARYPGLPPETTL